MRLISHGFVAKFEDGCFILKKDFSVDDLTILSFFFFPHCRANDPHFIWFEENGSTLSSDALEMLL